MIKKGLSVILLLILIYPVFSQAIPDELYGIWEGKDRFIFIENSQNDDIPKLSIVLKEFYGWYYDRAAEPLEYSQIEKRIRNDATPRKAENINIDFNLLHQIESGEAAYEILLQHSKYETSVIPVAVINNNMFLHFYYKDLSPEDLELIAQKKYTPTTNGLYKGNSISQGIKLDYQTANENIGVLKIIDDKYFDVRYWQTDMDYVSDLVNFVKDSYNFNTYKHIKSGNTIYSCVSGRSKKIRNPVGPMIFSKDNYVFSKYKTILVADENPYLTRIADKKTVEDLMKIIKTANSRRKPPAPPLFPPSDLDYHWDLIDALEKDNELIQAVRERQRAFGPRGKDFNR